MSAQKLANTTQTDNSASKEVIMSNNLSTQDKTHPTATPGMGGTRKGHQGKGKGNQSPAPTETSSVDSAPVESEKVSPVASANRAATATVAATPSKPRKGWKVLPLTPSGVDDLEASLAAAALPLPPPPVLLAELDHEKREAVFQLVMANRRKASLTAALPPLVLDMSPTAQLADLEREAREARQRADDKAAQVAAKMKEIADKKEAEKVEANKKAVELAKASHATAVKSQQEALSVQAKAVSALKKHNESFPCASSNIQELLDQIAVTEDFDVIKKLQHRVKLLREVASADAALAQAIDTLASAKSALDALQPSAWKKVTQPPAAAVAAAAAAVDEPAKKVKPAKKVEPKDDSDGKWVKVHDPKGKVTEEDKVRRAMTKVFGAHEKPSAHREKVKSPEEVTADRKAAHAANQERNVKAWKAAELAHTRKLIQENVARSVVESSLTDTDRKIRSARSSPAPRAAAASVPYPVLFPEDKNFGITQGPNKYKPEIVYVDMNTGTEVTYENMSPDQKSRISRGQTGTLKTTLLKILNGKNKDGECTWEYLEKQVEDWNDHDGSNPWIRTTEITADMLGPIEGFLASQIFMSPFFLGILCKALRELIPKAYLTVIPRPNRKSYVVQLTKFVGKHELESAAAAKPATTKPAAKPAAKPAVSANQYAVLAEPAAAKPATAKPAGKK